MEQAKIANELTALGLPQRQAQVYLAVLTAGQASVLYIAQTTKLDRAAVYRTIEELLEARLLHASSKGRRKVFVAEPPEGIRQLLKRRLSALDRVMPELVSLAEISETKPRIRYWEGVEGIKSAYRRSLQTKESVIVGFTGFEKLIAPSRVLDRFWTEEFVPARMKAHKKARLVAPDNPAGKRFKAADKAQFRETRLVQSDQYNFESEIFTYDDVVVCICYTGKETFALEVQSKPIAVTIKMIFEIVWKAAY